MESREFKGSSRLPTALPGLFQPLEISALPLPALVAASPSDLLAYIKDKESIFKALNDPDDAVVARIAALVTAADDSDIVLDLDASLRPFRPSNAASSRSSQLNSQLFSRLIENHENVAGILHDPPKTNASRFNLRSSPQFLRDSLVYSDAQNESDVMILDSASSDSESVEPITTSFHAMEDAEAIDLMEVDENEPNQEFRGAESQAGGRFTSDNLRGINSAIQQLRKWKERVESKVESKRVPLPEEIITGLISEFNLRASRNTSQSFKQLKEQDVLFVMACISDQVAIGLRCIEDSIPPAKDAELSRDVLATLFCSLEASLLGFTIFGCMDLSGQEDCVENILEFTKKLQRRLIFPRYDSMYQEVSGVAKVEFENSSDGDESHSDEKSVSGNDEKLPKGSSKLKSQSRKSKTAAVSAPHVVDSELVRMNFKLSDIYKTMSAVLSSGVSYPDTVALSASLCCLESFFVHNIVHLQLSCASVLACVCQKYAGLRHSILEDLVVSWPKILRDGQVSHDARIAAQSGKKQESINVYSLLVMEIVHACSGASALSTWSHRTALTAEKEASGAPLSADSTLPSSTQTSVADPTQEGSFLSAKHAAKSIVEQLFNRCASGTASDGNYRVLMQSFIDDLLKCMFHPEWPCAELILQLCAERLVNILRSQPDPQNAAIVPSKQSQLKEIAISMLGNIITEVKRESIANEASSTLFSSPKVGSTRADSIDDPEAKCPVCERPWEQQFMICCDSCQRWFHGDCIELAESDAPDCWTCDGCLVVEQVEYIRSQAAAEAAAPARKSKKQNAAALNAAPPPDREAVEQLVAKQFVWIHLTSRAATYPSAADALQYLFSQWIAEAKHQQDLALFKSWTRQIRFRANQLSLKSLKMLFTRLTLRHNIWSDLMRPLSFILFSLQDKDAKLRRSSLRSLQKILSVFPEWMAEPRVFNSIRTRFLDNAISVREVALDIVGDFMLTTPELAKQYYLPVVNSINDAGISVRKRVVRIMKALLLSPQTQNVIELADICVRLSTRLKDDFSIKAVVLSMFADMWIKGRLEPDAKEGGERLRPTTFTIQARVEQIIQVVQSIITNSLPGDVSSAVFFCELISRSLGLDSTQVEKSLSSKKSSNARDSIREIAESIFAVALSEPSSVEKKQITRKVSCFAVLHLMAKADPNLIVPLIEQLAPLLKTRELSPEWSHCLVHLCATAELVLTHMASSQDVQPIVAALEEDLVVIAKHFATNVVQVSLRTLCNIVQVTRSRTERIEQLYAECYLQLKEDLAGPMTPNLKRRICRNVFSLGAVCRYFVWPDLPKPTGRAYPDLSLLRSTKYGPHMENAFAILQSYWTSVSDVDIKAICVKGFAFLFSSCPGMLLRCESILKSALSQKSDDKLKVQALSGISDFMDEEDERAFAASKAGNPGNSVDDVKKVSIADSGASATIPQNYLAHVLDYMLCAAPTIRLAAIGLMKRLVKRGLVLHAKVISHLIAVHLSHYGTSLGQDALALITDGALDVASIGFHIGEAVNLVSSFIEVSRTPCQGWVVSNVSGVESTLVRLWSIVREQRQARNNFLFGLSRSLDRALSPQNGKGTGAQAFLAAKFVCEAVASMPFQKEDEVMLFISYLNNTIGGHLVSDVLEECKAALAAPASSSSSLLPCLRRCEISIKLFQVKTFLKSFYHISDAKLAAFTGTEALSKFASCSSKMSIHGADMSAPFDIPGVNTDWELSPDLSAAGKSLVKYLKSLFYDYEHETGSVELSKRTTRKRKAPASVGTDLPGTVSAQSKPRANKRRKTKENEESDYEDNF